MNQKIKLISAYIFILLIAGSISTVAYFKLASPKTPKPQVKGVSTTTPSKVPSLSKDSIPVEDNSDSTDNTSSQTASELALWEKIHQLENEIDDLQIPPAPDPNLATTTSYKFANQVDGCTLNKLSKQGWKISNMGSLEVASGSFLDETCKKVDAEIIDWVVLQKP